MARQASRIPIVTGDADYVHTFQTLCEVNLAIQDGGPTARLLLRKAYLQIALGDHVGAAKTSERLCTALPSLAEAWFLRGEAHLGIALVTIGAGVEAPHHDVPPGTDTATSLSDAESAYEMAVEFLAADAQAQDRLDLVRRLQACPDADAAHALVRGVKRPPRPRNARD